MTPVVEKRDFILTPGLQAASAAANAARLTLALLLSPACHLQHHLGTAF